MKLDKKVIALFCIKDISKEDDWADVWSKAETFFEGQVEILVNNAGIFGGVGSLDHKILEVNLIGLVHGTRLALDKMSAENGGNQFCTSILYTENQSCTSALYCYNQYICTVL